MIRSAFKPRTSTLKQSGFLRSKRKESGAIAKVRAMKSRGMKGRTPTAEESAFMSAMASLGCLACAKDGNQNSHISLHHIQGRTAPGAHLLVLSLCAQHHQQDDTDPMGRISLHGSKKRFEAMYGTEQELLAEAIEKLAGQKLAATSDAPITKT